jgi:ABC-2 type transport system permease protein
LLNPAATIAIYSLVFGVFLKVKPPVAGNGETQSFALYLFAALILWNFFFTVINASMASMVSAGPLIRKVYLPPECVPFSIVGSSILQTAVEASILTVIMIVLGNVSWTFLLFPPLLVLLMLFTSGIALVASMMNVYFRDVGYLVTIGLTLLFYATPIIYTITLIPETAWGLPMRDIIEANPLTQFVMAARDIFYLLEVPSLSHWAYIFAWSVGSLAVGWWIFSRRSSHIPEEL